MSYDLALEEGEEEGRHGIIGRRGELTESYPSMSLIIGEAVLNHDAWLVLMPLWTERVMMTRLWLRPVQLLTTNSSPPVPQLTLGTSPVRSAPLPGSSES
jgi:hypothetical protein